MGGPRPGPTGPRPKDGTDQDSSVKHCGIIMILYILPCFGEAR